MEAATIPSLWVWVIKQVNKVVALLKISSEHSNPRAESSEWRQSSHRKDSGAILLAAERTSSARKADTRAFHLTC